MRILQKSMFTAILMAAGSLVVAQEEAPKSFKVSAVTFERPPSWKWVKPTSSMRKAQLKVVSTEPKGAADVVFFYFGPGGAGGKDANIQRWFRKFKGARTEKNSKRETKNIAGVPVTFVKAAGIYNDSPPFGAPRWVDNHALLGAIIEAKSGSIFVRLTGPDELASKLEPEFKRMIEGGVRGTQKND